MPKINFSSLAQLPFLLRIGCFVVALVAVWLPLAGPIYLIWGTGNTVSIITMLLLYSEFVWLLRLWGQQLYRQAHSLRFYGLAWSARFRQELLAGLAVGFLTLMLMFILEGGLGWLTWQPPNPKFNLGVVVVEGLAITLGVSFAEELLFRGWLLQELERDYSLSIALWANSLLFALLHFIRPLEAIIATWTQFFGLSIMGVSLVWGRRLCQGRLSFAIGLHWGLIWSYYIINVPDLVKYSGQVPAWVTGIGNNPLAGLIGLAFLSSIAIAIRLQMPRLRN
ncbi:MAG: CPBP family intramembrane metalloprotease [Aphanocapsa sp. GSE-SYN-MK-11-07L]|nr:CPBP family intramembrane metalloprotease [Aphanocapsa sp. GSE-SYN-MK-11-07L]